MSDNNDFNIETYKSIISISETLSHYKDVLKSILEMSIQSNSDMKVMNEKMENIEETIKGIYESIDSIQKQTIQMITQLDLKEREEILKKINKNKKKFDWQKFFSIIIKYPRMSILIAVIILGTILVIHGVITKEQFVEGIGKIWPF